MSGRAALGRESQEHLNLGCGPGDVPEGWINLDGSWNAWLAKHWFLRRLFLALHLHPSRPADEKWDSRVVVHDVRKPLLFPDNSLSSVYASHLLEHLYLAEAKDLLKECYRVLKPRGILRVVVPDLHAIVQEYTGERLLPKDRSSESSADKNPADRVNLRLAMHNPSGRARNAVLRIYNALTDFHSHKWMYDIQSLTFYLVEAGFVDVQEMAFRQSRIEGIETVEKAVRVLDGAGICVEGAKPEGSRDHHPSAHAGWA